jgi:hypothetical protein
VAGLDRQTLQPNDHPKPTSRPRKDGIRVSRLKWRAESTRPMKDIRNAPDPARVGVRRFCRR